MMGRVAAMVTVPLTRAGAVLIATSPARSAARADRSTCCVLTYIGHWAKALCRAVKICASTWRTIWSPEQGHVTGDETSTSSEADKEVRWAVHWADQHTAQTSRGPKPATDTATTAKQATTHRRPPPAHQGPSRTIYLRPLPVTPITPPHTHERQ
jgi:hypothetical protein